MLSARGGVCSGELSLSASESSRRGLGGVVGESGREYAPSNPASLTGLTSLEPSGARKLRLGGAFANGGAGGRDFSCAGRTTGLHVTVLVSKWAAQLPMALQVKFVASRP